MSKKEILLTPAGEMIDMISCLAVYNGHAREVHRITDIDEIIKLR